MQQTWALAASVLLFFFAQILTGCGPAANAKGGSSGRVANKDAVILVAAERTSQGGRLVQVSGDGARQSALTKLPPGLVTLDRSPVFTPDGTGLVFVSNRERGSLAETSLWFVPALGGAPRRLTEGPSVDRDPRISPDGRWLYFCSNRDESFDVYRASFDAAAGTMGEVERVTRRSEQVLSPSISPDGKDLSYMAVDDQGESSIWRTPAWGRGEAVQLTLGPMDMTPAWGPGDVIAFASRAVGRDDADLFLIDADGSHRRTLIDAPNTDETGPRWSRDGRYLFAIGMYRSASDGKPLLGSIVFVDMQEKKRSLRALHDPSAVESRIGLAIRPAALDSKLMRSNASYEAALQSVLLQSAVRNEKERMQGQKDAEKTSPSDP
jgi:dipeptidyl aminopeptidase/acylaminoacyl peptidase